MPRLWFALLLIFLAGCAPPSATPAPVTALAPTARVSAATSAIATRTPAPSPSVTATLTPSATATLPVIDFYEPAGCLEPPREAGEVLEVNGWQLNARTLAMLRHAQTLYGGPVDLAGVAVTQGSYHDNGSLSFGTHTGGGAVDLSIFLPGTWQVDFTNLNRLVMSLRAAGFAAWVRSIDEVFPGSGYHIHAIALGDPQLSPAAHDQLEGRFGYLRGFNGLPQEDGVAVPDLDGSPLLCAWMLELGYADLRADPAALPSASVPPADWQTRLLDAARSFEAATPQESAALAARLYTTPEGLPWVLPGALWQAAGLLPRGVSPADNPRNFAKLRSDPETFWSWFSPDDYSHAATDAPPRTIDLTAGVLLPGDLLYVHPAAGGTGLPLVIVGLDAQNRPLALAAGQGADGWRVQIQPAEEVLSGSEWQNYDLLRYRGLGLPPGIAFAYSVQPGDTLPGIAARFGATLERLLRANHLPDPARLQVGQVITIVR